MVVFKGLFINNRIKVLGQPANLPPVWVTPEGEIGKARRGEGIGYKLLATDDNTLVRYSVVSGTLPSFLSVTAGGIVTGVVPASATEEDFKPFTVRASDPYGLYADRTFFLTYDAPTPFAPVWNTPSFLGSYPALESMSITVWATADSGATIVSYALAPYSGPLPAGLSIDNTGAIRGSPEMVSNTTNFFFVVRATDSQGRFSDRSFQLAVAYTNTPPKFASNAGRITAGEIGDEIRYQLKATDDKGIVAWNIVAGSLPPGLRLLSSGLIIGKTQPVATTTDYEFAVEVVDEGGLKDTRVFSIRVWAPNAAPVITSPANLGSFPETAQNLRIRLEAEDDRNSFVEWRLVSGTLPPGMALRQTGYLESDRIRDVTEDSTYTFSVRATDTGDIRGKNKLFTEKQFSLEILNVPNEAPVITTPEGLLRTIAEGQTFEIKLLATDDRQEPDEISWAVSPETPLPSWMNIRRDGTVAGRAPEVMELTTVTFTAIATDRGTLYSAPLSTSATFSIEISDVNQPPEIHTVSDLGQAWPLVPFSVQLEATDDKAIDGWSVAVGDLPPGFELSNDGLLSGILPNRMERGVSNFTLEVRDNQGLTTTKQFTILLMSTEDALNNLPPVLSTPSGVVLDQSEDQIVEFQFEAVDDWGIHQWEIRDSNLPEGFTLSNQGLLRGHLPDVEDDETYTFTIRVVDGLGELDEKDYAIINRDINLPSVILPKNADLGFRYVGRAAYIEFSATDDKGEVTWEIDETMLPAGLRWGPDNILSGVMGSVDEDTIYTFPITVVDPKGARTTKEYRLAAYTEAPGFITPSGSIGSFVATTQMSFAIRMREGLSAIRDFMTTALPAGLQINSATGEIQGTPQQVMSDTVVSFTVTATDVIGRSSQRQFSIEIKRFLEAPTIITPGYLGAYVYETSISIALQTSDNARVASWEISSGTLPNGVSLDAATGLISGQAPLLASPEDFEFVVQITDTDGMTATKNFILGIADVAKEPLPDTDDGQPGNGGTPEVPPEQQAPVFQGETVLFDGNEEVELANVRIGVAAIPVVTRFEIIDGDFPSTLTLNNQTGQITGTTPSVGENTVFQFVVKITTGLGKTATRSFTIRVKNITPPIFDVEPVLPSGEEWSNYSFTLRTVISPTATKATSWQLVAGNFPATLELDAKTGRISGKMPDVRDDTNFVFTVRVTGDNALSTTREFTLPVRVTGPIWNARPNTKLGSIVAGAPMTPLALTAFNGDNLVYSVASGSLPDGLTLTRSGTLSGTPSPTGQSFKNFSFVVRVTSDENRYTDKTFSIGVSLNPPVWVTPEDRLWQVNEGAEYEIELEATDEDNDIATYMIVSGSLPAGARLNPYSGVLSGIAPTTLPASTTYEFRVRVEDAEGGYAERDFSIRIIHYRTTVVWQTKSGPLVPASPGTEYDFTLTATTRKVAS